MSEIMAEANHQDLAMEQDPEDVMLKKMRKIKWTMKYKNT